VPQLPNWGEIVRKLGKIEVAMRICLRESAAKKLISIFFALIITLSSIPAYSLATESDETDFRIPIYPVVTASDITNQLNAQYQPQSPDSKIHSQIKDQIKQRPKDKLSVVLRVKNDEQLEHISKLIRDKGGRIKGKYKIGDVIAADVPAGAIQSLAGYYSIDEIAPERGYQAFLSESIPNLGIEAYAWDNSITGNGIKIAILDTGIDYNHEMFDNTQIISQTFVGEPSIDANGHGTHCAGIAAGNGLYKGVAKGASLLNSKVLDSNGIGTTSSIIAGINWAVEQDADIISMSFGSTISEFDGPLAAAIREAISQNIIFIAASGNCGSGCGGFYGVTFPGSMQEVITVGAVDDNNAHAYFSSGQSFGNYIKPDVVAYGVSIISSYKNNDYKTMSGTSMATPFVSGIAALMLEKNSSLTPSEIKQRLETNAIDLGVAGKDTKYGYGMPDLKEIFESNETIDETDDLTNLSSTSPTQTVSGVEPQPVDDLNATIEPLSMYIAEYLAAGCSTQQVCGGTCWVCSKPEAPHFNCDESDGQGWCCPLGAPYLYEGYCYDDPTIYGCKVDSPYYCAKTGGGCWPGPSYCDVSESCGGSWHACEDVNDIFSCVGGEPYCCSEDYPYYCEADGDCHRSLSTCDSGSEEGDGVCDPGEWDQEDGCHQCDNDQCVSYVWEECYDHEELCCDGDNTDDNPETTFGQYICMDNNEWAVCAPDLYWCGFGCHDECAQQDNYYCTYQEGFWKWRECNNGCSGQSCITSICGNGLCEEDESTTSCPTDCNSDIKIIDFVNPPTELTEGQSTSISVKLKNFGSVYDSTKVEVGIIPTDFFIRGFSSTSYSDIPGCCEANEYYDTREVSLSAGQEQIVTFNPYAPSRDSYDHCWDDWPAWSNSFKIVVVAYTNCGDVDFEKEVPVDVSIDPCPGECRDYNEYSCDGDVIEKCALQSDGCYERESIHVCSRGTYCQEGKSTCQTSTKYTDIQVEDAADGKLVYKQPGDLLKIRLDLKSTETIYLDYDVSAFQLLDGGCNLGNVYMNSDKECMFEISNDADTGTYHFKITGGDVERIGVIDDPTLLIITNKDKLSERFDNDIGVSDLLEQAYETASKGERGIVYDLGIELGGHPWEDYQNDYREDPLTPEMNDNSYSLQIGQFIREKCKTCDNIIILGDDFVVPHYRRDIANYEGWWLFEELVKDKVYSDIPYIIDTKPTFSNLDEFFDDEKVAFVVPDSLDPTTRNKVELLKASLVDKFRNKNSNLLSVNQIQEKSSSQVGCNSFDDLEERTLIIIGTEETNNAVACLPFVSEFENTISLERNVWSDGEIAIILRGNVDSITAFDDLLTHNFPDNLLDASIIYIQQGIRAVIDETQDFLCPHVNDPSDGFFKGLGLGECNDFLTGCQAGDVVSGVLVYGDIRDAGYYCLGICGREGSIVCGFAAFGVISTFSGPGDLGVTLVKQVGKKGGPELVEAIVRIFGKQGDDVAGKVIKEFPLDEIAAKLLSKNIDEVKFKDIKKVYSFILKNADIIKKNSKRIIKELGGDESIIKIMLKTDIGANALLKWGPDAQKGLYKVFNKQGKEFAEELLQQNPKAFHALTEYLGRYPGDINPSMGRQLRDFVDNFDYYDWVKAGGYKNIDSASLVVSEVTGEIPEEAGGILFGIGKTPDGKTWLVKGEAVESALVRQQNLNDLAAYRVDKILDKQNPLVRIAEAHELPNVKMWGDSGPSTGPELNAFVVEWVEGASFEKLGGRITKLQKMAVQERFLRDFWMGNFGRHSHDFMITPKGKVFFYDNGYSLSVIPGFLDESVSFESLFSHKYLDPAGRGKIAVFEQNDIYKELREIFDKQGSKEIKEILHPEAERIARITREELEAAFEEAGVDNSDEIINHLIRRRDEIKILFGIS